MKPGERLAIPSPKPGPMGRSSISPLGVARPGGRHRHRYHGALALGLDRHRWARVPAPGCSPCVTHSPDSHPEPGRGQPKRPFPPPRGPPNHRPARPTQQYQLQNRVELPILSQVNMSQILCDVCHIFSSLISSKMQLRAVRRAARKISVHTPDQVGAHAVMSKNLDDVPRPLRFSVSFVAVAALLLGTLSAHGTTSIRSPRFFHSVTFGTRRHARLRGRRHGQRHPGRRELLVGRSRCRPGATACSRSWRSRTPPPERCAAGSRWASPWISRRSSATRSTRRRWSIGCGVWATTSAWFASPATVPPSPGSPSTVPSSTPRSRA